MIIASITSVIVSSFVFSANKATMSVENIPIITSDFPTRDTKIFNNLNVDPTVLIHIDNNNNNSLFNSGR